MLNKNAKYVWTEECESAYQKIINSIADDAILYYPDWTKKFHLFVDASAYALAGILAQREQDSGRWRVITMNSIRLNSAQRNYGAVDREWLAIVKFTLRYSYYLVGSEFVIYTDHRPLTYIMYTNNMHSRIMNGMLLLQPYRFKIVYIKGPENPADYASRVMIGLHQLQVVANTTLFSVDPTYDAAMRYHTEGHMKLPETLNKQH